MVGESPAKGLAEPERGHSSRILGAGWTVQVNASAAADIHKSDHLTVLFQIDGQNFSNVLDVIDFCGPFSGNAIGPSRSVALRLTTKF